MSGETSCIQHPSSSPFLIIRDGYLAICDENHCAAALLSVFEGWHNTKLKNADQAAIDISTAVKEGISPEQSDSLWVYKSQPQLKHDLLGLFGESKIAAGIAFLIKQGFITSRNNPRYKWDRKLQFLFHPENVQNALTQKYVDARRKNTPSKTRKKVINDAKESHQSHEKTAAIAMNLSTTPPMIPSKEKEIEQPSDPEESRRLAETMFQDVLKAKNGYKDANTGLIYTDADIAEQTRKAYEKYPREAVEHGS